MKKNVIKTLVSVLEYLEQTERPDLLDMTDKN